MFLIILKLRKIDNHEVKKLSYLLKYVPDQYKTQQMGEKTIPENGRTSESIHDCYKNQEMCSKAVENYPYVLKFVPKWFMTQEICDKAVNAYSTQLNLFLNAL